MEVFIIKTDINWTFSDEKCGSDLNLCRGKLQWRTLNKIMQLPKKFQQILRRIRVISLIRIWHQKLKKGLNIPFSIFGTIY